MRSAADALLLVTLAAVVAVLLLPACVAGLRAA